MQPPMVAIALGPEAVHHLLLHNSPDARATGTSPAASESRPPRASQRAAKAGRLRGASAEPAGTGFAGIWDRLLPKALRRWFNHAVLPDSSV